MSTITDAQIRELLDHPGTDRATRRLCKVALNDAPTYLRASVVRDARARLAPIYAARSKTVWLDGNLMCDNVDPAKCTGCRTLAEKLRGS